MNRYPLWKNILVIVVTLVAVFLALPNLYPEAPALNVTRIGASIVPPAVLSRIERHLEAHHLSVKRARIERDHILLVFAHESIQRRALVLLKQVLGEDYSVAPNLVPETPDWLRTLGLKPMPEGLDLRGGIYFLLEVDTRAAVHDALGRIRTSLEVLLRHHGIRYLGVSRAAAGLRIELARPVDLRPALHLIQKEHPHLVLHTGEAGGFSVITARYGSAQKTALNQVAVVQDVAALRRRVNELGVTAAVVEQQGAQDVVVELPGIQDAARAERRLGDTATVQFRLVDDSPSAQSALQSGQVPPGARRFTTTQGAPVLLSSGIIVSGREIVNATSAYVNGQPAVNVTLNSRGGNRMLETTSHNLNQPMAVLYIENRSLHRKVDGQSVIVTKKIERVISIATIRGVFSSNFQITGLTERQANKLALLLRTPLAAPMTVVAERTIGPSLGRENIRDGVAAVILGFALVVLFMAFYYKWFGVIADLALFVNLILIVALLSLLQATLTLPGIAGMVLTVGMAIDANVLIYERIREELRNGASPQAAIHAGYERAWGTIVDSHVTALIAGVLLFLLGSGPVKGFAITLCLGILTSLYTAVMNSRAITNAVYGGRRLTRLPV
ncbi:MAG: protein translocase subunit SecD [Gammaproteobacteria bacterium]